MRHLTRILFALLLALLLAAASSAAAAEDTVGVVDRNTGVWSLRDGDGDTFAFFYGNPGDVPFAGDWDCDGVDTPGLYRQSDGFVYLRNSNTQGVADITFFFGNPGDIPIAGDFNGDDCDTVSIHRPSQGRVFIINQLGKNGGGLGAAEVAYYFGNPGDIPFTGDFDNDGVDTVGLYRQRTGSMYFRNTHTQGIADFDFFYGNPGDRFVGGDWTGDGTDTPGVFRPSNTTFYLKYHNTQGNADEQFRYGTTSSHPVAGNWGDIPTTPQPPPGAGSVRFVAGGDVGGRDDRAGDVFRSMVTQNSDFFLLLGDLSYSEITPESAWCTWIKSYFPANYPIEVITGNHEDNGPDGYIRNFTPCIPDRMGASGDYGVEYYFDTGPVRVIMVAADLTVDGVGYRYDRPGVHRDWLLARIDEAEAAGRWTVVGMHKVCVTTGSKSCEIGEAMVDDMISHGADLILHGHDHDYQRSHQLACIDTNTTTPACIVDTDSDHQAETGAVIAIAGWVGRGGTDVSPTDSEAGYYATIAGPNQPGWTRGYLTVTATNTTLTGTWTSAQGGNADTFTVQR